MRARIDAKSFFDIYIVHFLLNILLFQTKRHKIDNITLYMIVVNNSTYSILYLTNYIH